MFIYKINETPETSGEFPFSQASYDLIEEPSMDLITEARITLSYKPSGRRFFFHGEEYVVSLVAF